MKKYLTVLISIFIFTGILGINSAFPQSDPLDSVLTRYFDALKTGNLQILRSLLSDELLKSRSKALSNPRYSEFLKSIYGQARFSIINTTQLKNDQIAVDIEVHSDGQTRQTETITFIKEQGAWKLLKDRKDAGS